MTRLNALRNVLRNIAASRDSVAWGKEKSSFSTDLYGNVNALVFSAVLIVCSVTVGCSSDKPKPVSSNNQIPVMPVQSATAATQTTPVMQVENKPAPKKVVHKKPATVNYTDKTYGVTFEYPRRYAIETGDAAAELLLSNPVPMNFVQPGGVALAAVELPETGFANTDFSSAFFDVSVHKSLTADQCGEFAVPQPKNVALTAAETRVESAPSTSAISTSVETQPSRAASSAETAVASAKTTSAETQAAAAQSATTQASTSSDQTNAQQTRYEEGSVAKVANEPAQSTSSASESSSSKLLLGDMELRATEAVSGEGPRQSDSKYFHLFQNGACYEFALNVTTVGSQDGAGLMKHVDRDKVFSRLEKILDTVKINSAATEATSEGQKTPPTATASENPAQ